MVSLYRYFKRQPIIVVSGTLNRILILVSVSVFMNITQINAHVSGGQKLSWPFSIVTPRPAAAS